MNSHCVCYITDQRYLLPTFLSAQQARAHTSLNAVDIIIFVSGVDADAFAAFDSAAKDEGITLMRVPGEIIETVARLQKDQAQHFSGRIPPLSFSRLLLHRFLPKQYTDFLYIDGDTQIRSSLDPLAACTMPDEKFYASRDYNSIMACAGAYSPDFDHHITRLGLSRAGALNYFNSGVLRSSTRTWADVGERAFDFFVHHADLCHPYHEQGALNGSCSESHVLVSSHWNAPRQLMPLLRDPGLKPAIVHYMAHPKPWHGTFYPWKRDEHRAYVHLVEKHPGLAEYTNRLSRLRFSAYKMKSMRTQLLDSLRAERPVIDGPMAEGVI